MTDFEAIRRGGFDRQATEVLGEIDRQTGLIPSTGKKFGSSVHDQADGADIRSTARAVVPLFMTGHTDLARKAIDGILDHQDCDRQSLTYGNFRWYSGWKTARDPNAASFIVPHLWYVHRNCRDDLEVPRQQRLEAALSMTLEGLNAHRATWEYTNIAILNMASKLCIADILGDVRARKIAYWDWDEWRNHVARLGFLPEYNSPNYTSVQAHGLAIMLDCEADSDFHREVLSVLRHLLTSLVLDYHEVIGLPTGAASRGIVGRRGRSGIDDLMYYLGIGPEPKGGCKHWLGVAIGPGDILPCGLNLSLPRTTCVNSHGHFRRNYLSEDFALGSTHGRAHWTEHTVPFLLAYRTSRERCTIPFVSFYASPAEAYFSTQREGKLLGGGIWLISDDQQWSLKSDYWRSHRTGLNCGRAENITDLASLLFYRLDLGRFGEVVLYDARGNQLDGSQGRIEGTVVAVETESILAVMNFHASGGGPRLELACRKGDGEFVLTVCPCSGSGVSVSTDEKAQFCGFRLDVLPRQDQTRAAAAARSAADRPLSLEMSKGVWTLSATAEDGTVLNLDIDPQPACFYAVDDVSLTANQWALSLIGLRKGNADS